MNVRDCEGFSAGAFLAHAGFGRIGTTSCSSAFEFRVCEGDSTEPARGTGFERGPE